MGVSGQRYSSTLVINLLVTASLILAPLPLYAATGAKPQSGPVEEAEEDSASLYGAVASDFDLNASLVNPAPEALSRQIHLPPALTAFLTILMGLCNLADRPEAVEDPKRKLISKEEQLILLMTAAQAIPEIYGDIQEYEVDDDHPPIQSLARYIQLVEPTHVDRGSLMGNRNALYRIFKQSKDKLPKAYKVTKIESYASLEVWAQVQVYEHNRMRKMQQALSGLTQIGSGSAYPSSIVATLVRTMLSTIFQSKGLGGIVEEAAARLANAPAPAAPAVAEAVVPASPAEAEITIVHGKVRARDFAAMTAPPGYLSNSKKRAWEERHAAAKKVVQSDPDTMVDYPFPKPQVTAPPAPPAVVAAPNQSAFSYFTSAVDKLFGRGGITLTGAVEAAASAAKFFDNMKRFSTIDALVVEALKRVRELDTEGMFNLIEQAQHHLRTALLPELNAIAMRVSQSSEMEGIEDPRTRELVRIFFADYPKTLEADVIRDFLQDIWNLPLDTQDFALAKLLVLHYDPIAQQLFQTVGSSGVLEKVFERLRDRGKTAPYAQVMEIIRADPNQYPLKNVSREAVAAGKIFQVHSAIYTHGDGREQEVMVRVLKPGVEERLERARTRLLRLAGRIAEAMKKDGRGPTQRRIEQLIEMIYRNLKQEFRVDQTVRVQTKGRTLLSETEDFFLPGGDPARLEISVPRVFPAQPGSTVMVMEKVNGIVDLDTMEQRYPEVLRFFANKLALKTIRGILIDPMIAAEAAAKAEVAAESAAPEAELNAAEAEPVEESGYAEEKEVDRRYGFMHADLHTGNFLFEQPVLIEGERVLYRVKIIDFGLAVAIAPEQVQEVVKLAVGAAYNNAPFIIDSIWSLGAQEMSRYDDVDREEARAKFEDMVHEKIAKLNKEKKFWGPAEWVSYLWENEAVDLPAWLVLMEQGFQAVRSSHKKLGRSPTELAKLSTELARAHKSLTYRYLQAREKGHDGWGQVKRFEVADWLKKKGRSCIATITSPFVNKRKAN
ncbi:hypothetical protein K2X33_01550 [bacterium]|nr:hypothetical protein [bacterium]